MELHLNIEIVILLIEMGADINAQGGCYSNALVAAASEGHKAIVNLLIDNGAKVHVGKQSVERHFQQHQNSVI